MARVGTTFVGACRSTGFHAFVNPQVSIYPSENVKHRRMPPAVATTHPWN